MLFTLVVHWCWHCFLICLHLHLRSLRWWRKSADRRIWKSTSMLRRRERVPGHLWRRRLLRGILRWEIGRYRRLPLLLHVHLHVRRRWRVGILVILRHVVGRVLWVVDGWLRNVSVAVVDLGTLGMSLGMSLRVSLWVPLWVSLRMSLWVSLRVSLLRSVWADLRGNQIRRHPPHVIARSRPRARVRLWSMSPMCALEDHSIWYGRRC